MQLLSALSMNGWERLLTQVKERVKCEREKKG